MTYRRSPFLVVWLNWGWWSNLNLEKAFRDKILIQYWCNYRWTERESEAGDGETQGKACPAGERDWRTEAADGQVIQNHWQTERWNQKLTETAQVSLNDTV